MSYININENYYYVEDAINENLDTIKAVDGARLVGERLSGSHDKETKELSKEMRNAHNNIRLGQTNKKDYHDNNKTDKEAAKDFKKIDKEATDKRKLHKKMAKELEESADLFDFDLL